MHLTKSLVFPHLWVISFWQSFHKVPDLLRTAKYPTRLQTKSSGKNFNFNFAQVSSANGNQRKFQCCLQTEGVSSQTGPTLGELYYYLKNQKQFPAVASKSVPWNKYIWLSANKARLFNLLYLMFRWWLYTFCTKENSTISLIAWINLPFNLLSVYKYITHSLLALAGTAMN